MTANRLEKVMNFVIFESQFVFIKHRHSFDGILVINGVKENIIRG